MRRSDVSMEERLERMRLISEESLRQRDEERRELDRALGLERHERLCLLALAVAKIRIFTEYGSVESARATAQLVAEGVTIDERLRPSSRAIGKLVEARIVSEAVGSAHTLVWLVSQWI